MSKELQSLKFSYSRFRSCLRNNYEGKYLANYKLIFRRQGKLSLNVIYTIVWTNVGEYLYTSPEIA